MKIEDLSLYDLKYFLDTVERGSLTGSAQVNFVTRPAISLALQRLEQWAGKKLMTHEKRVFALTEAGEEFYRSAKASYLAFKHSLESGSSGLKGSLKIGCSVSLFDQFLSPALRRLGPLSDSHVMTGTSLQIKHRLKEGEINLGLYIDEGERFDLQTHEIFRGTFVLASKSGTKSKSLVTTERRPEVTSLERALHKSKVIVESHIRVESWGLCTRLASSLGAMCLVPDCLLPTGMTRIPLPGFQPKYRVCISSRGAEHLSNPEAKLLALLT